MQAPIPRWKQIDYADAAALADAIAGILADACRAGIDHRGRARLVLAGGRTPFPAYRALATQPLNWPRVQVIASDERCVPPFHPASNTSELRRAFADALGIDISELVAADGDPAASEAHARTLLARMPEPFDAVVLGMGTDAHTASLFPGAQQTAAAMAQGAADAYRIDPSPLPPEAPFARVSLSLPRLLHTRSLHVVITGEAKLAVLKKAHSASDPLRMPISAVLHAADVNLSVHWSP